MLIAGISTLIFNGNPLLRYDGYYILADLIEIPNLAQRADALLGLPARALRSAACSDAEPPDATPGERAWFVFYGVASFALPPVRHVRDRALRRRRVLLRRRAARAVGASR